VVEELLPASVTLVAEVNVDERIAFWLDRFLDKSQARLPWCATTFFDIAFRTGTNNILPNRFAAHTSWDDVVKGQLAGRIAFAAILTSIFVTSKDVPTVEFYIVSGQAVEK